MARFKKLVSSIVPIRWALAVVSQLIRTGWLLFPWVPAVWLYWQVLRSPQGVALSDSLYYDIAGWRIFGIVSGATVLVCISVLVMLIAAAAYAERTPPPRTEPTSEQQRVVAFVGAATWIVVLTIVFPLALAVSTRSPSAWYAVLFALAFALCVILLAYRNTNNCVSLMRRATVWVAKYRAASAFIALAFAITPLLVVGAWVGRYPLHFSSAGALLVGLFGIVCVFSMLSHVTISFSLCSGWRPFGASLLLVGAVISANRAPEVEFDNRLILREVESASLKSHDPNCVAVEHVEGAVLRQATGNMVGHRTTHAKELPFTFVSAEGGGIRAAYWVAANLAHRDIATDGEFSRRITSLSGVSGGSLGIAAWLAVLERQDLSPAERLDRVSEYLGSDFLSPLIAGLFFLDIPRAMMPLWYSTNRAEVFEKAIAERWQEVGETDFFYRRLRDLCMIGLPSVPAVAFGTTNALKGEFYRLPSELYIADSLAVSQKTIGEIGLNRFDGTAAYSKIRSSIYNASVAQAVSISARFPYLAPAAIVGVKEEAIGKKQLDDTVMNEPGDDWIAFAALVDGGYVDNSALTPTIDGIRYLKQMRTFTHSPWFPIYSKTPLEVLHFSNDPAIACDQFRQGLMRAKADIRCSAPRARTPKWVSQLVSPLYVPLQATFGVRSVHVKEMRDRLDATMNDPPLVNGDHPEFVHLANAVYDVIYQRRPTLEKAHNLASVFPDEDLGPDELAALDLIAKYAEANAGEMGEELQSSWNMTLANTERAAEVETIPVEVIESNDSQLEWVTKWIKEHRPNVDPVALKKWHATMSKEAKKSNCEFEDKQYSVPLGWTLTKRFESTTRCLAFRSALVSGAKLLPIK